MARGGFDPTLPLEAAATPPAAWYVDPAAFQLERRSVLLNHWQPVGRLEQVRSCGDYITGTFLDRPYVVVRDESGTLRAFDNVCRHHAAIVACGEGSLSELVCPYHGWTYTLAGRLRRAPALGRSVGFDPATCGLPSLAVATWGPWVWLHFGRGQRDLDRDLAPLAAWIDPASLAGLRFVCRRTWELDCNWKVFVDNYLDGGYHVERVHRGLAGQLSLDGYATQVFERGAVQTCPASRAAASRDDFAERIGDGAAYAWVYPAFMLNRYGPILDTNWVVPLAVDRTLTVFDYYFDPDVAQRDAQFVSRSLAASEAVQNEDVAVCESVQRGLRSGTFDQGPYAVPVEQAMHHFHRLLAADLDGADGGH